MSGTSKALDSALSELSESGDLSRSSAPSHDEAFMSAPEEARVSLDTAMKRAQRDFNFLAALAMPLVFKYLWPGVYLAAFALIVDKLALYRDFSKIAFGFPRGFAKTTFVKLVILWIILFTRRSYILIIGSNEDKAVEILSDVTDMLSESNIIKIFGNWKFACEEDNKKQSKFSFRGRDIILKAIGRGGSVRGVVSKHRRPDVMIFDDIQEREDADSEIEFRKLKSWFFGTALKAASPEGCLYLFLANMYPTPFSMLGHLRKLKSWTKFITGCITVEGKSLWEELQPLKQLMAEYAGDVEAGEAATFLSEKMNDENATASRYFDSDKILLFHDWKSVAPQGKFILIDPAGRKKTSDDNVIGYFEVIDGTPMYCEISHGKFSPKQVIQEALKLGWKHNCRLICAEDTAYQETLLFWFQDYCEERGIEGFFFRPVSRRGVSKNADILNSFKSLMQGEWGMTPDVRDVYVKQAVQFDPLTTKNIDDVIDVPCHVQFVLSEYPGLIVDDYTMSDNAYGSEPILSNSVI